MFLKNLSVFGQYFHKLLTRCASLCARPATRFKNLARPLFPILSIPIKLTLFYSLATLILMLSLALVFYFSMLEVMLSADRQFLSDEISIMQNLLKKPEDSRALKQEVMTIPNSLNTSVYHYYIRILNPQGNIMLETPGMDTIALKNNFDLSENLVKKWRTTQGDSYLLMQATQIDKNHRPWGIQIALDVSSQEKILNQYRQWGISILLIGTLLTIFLGYVISLKGMRRLYELTELTKKMTSQTLQQRIDAKFWPTELSELVSAYNDMLSRIESSFSRLTAFTDDLAHEIRTPITNLMGEIEVVLAGDYSIQEYRSIMESNLEELNRLYHIAENILFLARVQNPQHEISKESLDIAAEINIICQFYQAIADEKNIHIICTGHARGRVNSIMFRRLMSNLLSNALQYSPPGGEVRLQIDSDPRYINISLRDSGIGIAQENLPKLFDRFFREETSRAQNSGGVGLGLAIVKSIIELHHGTITISSEKNVGTRVVINIPK